MSGPSFAEFLILCMIGLVVLGPKRLPEVARQVGMWVGKARRMTSQLKRQLEEELDVEKNFGFDPKQMHIPLEDDTYSPVHDADTDPPAEEEPAEEKDEDEKEA